jgi:hypothetical protein
MEDYTKSPSNGLKNIKNPSQTSNMKHELHSVCTPIKGIKSISSVNLLKQSETKSKQNNNNFINTYTASFVKRKKKMNESVDV